MDSRVRAVTAALTGKAVGRIQLSCDDEFVGKEYAVNYIRQDGGGWMTELVVLERMSGIIQVDAIYLYDLPTGEEVKRMPLSSGKICVTTDCDLQVLPIWILPRE